MAEVRLPKVALVLVQVALVGCHSVPKAEEQWQSPQIGASTSESSPSRNTPSDDSCGLDDSPVSKSTREILAGASRDAERPPNQMMIAKVAINAEGRVTHLRVLRLAWPKLPNSYAINEHAVNDIKGWHYKPTILGGKPVAVCSDVAVTVDLE